MIDFELSEGMQNMRNMTHMLAEQAMRPISREYDEKEHEKPWDFLNMMWGVSRGASMTGDSGEKKERKGPSEQNLSMCVTVEELCWGDVGLYLSIPNPGLGGAAVAAAGTPEQKERFLARFKDGDHWVLNGTKIFCTSGLMAAEKSKGFVVVWATLDRSAGRAGIRAFVVDSGTPGMYVTKVEHKLGIRASDTATLVFEDCRIPLDNILGSAEIPKPGTQTNSQGFKGAMATFDATRPIVAASAIGVARAALDYVKDALADHGVTLHYGAPMHKLTALERDVMEMEAQVQAARLLVWRAAWMLDNGQRNNLEASMS
jgi:acyl-CoA dehydrogenase